MFSFSFFFLFGSTRETSDSKTPDIWSIPFLPALSNGSTEKWQGLSKKQKKKQKGFPEDDTKPHSNIWVTLLLSFYAIVCLAHKPPATRKVVRKNSASINRVHITPNPHLRLAWSTWLIESSDFDIFWLIAVSRDNNFKLTFFTPSFMVL